MCFVSHQQGRLQCFFATFWLLFIGPLLEPWLAAQLGSRQQLYRKSVFMCVCVQQARPATAANECSSAPGPSGQLHASHEGQTECLL